MCEHEGAAPPVTHRKALSRMYHFAADIVKRSDGRSIVAAATYPSADRLMDERLGKVHDFTRKRGVVATQIMAPPDAPAWVRDRGRLWNAVEAVEKRKDAQLARQVVVSLPAELSAAGRAALIFDFCRTHFVSAGMVADVALHDPDAGDPQPHAHIHLTMRRLEADGFGAKERAWNDPGLLTGWREAWSAAANAALAAEGHAARFDHRSLDAQRAEAQARAEAATDPRERQRALIEVVRLTYIPQPSIGRAAWAAMQKGMDDDPRFSDRIAEWKAAQASKAAAEAEANRLTAALDAEIAAEAEAEARDLMEADREALKLARVMAQELQGLHGRYIFRRRRYENDLVRYGYLSHVKEDDLPGAMAARAAAGEAADVLDAQIDRFETATLKTAARRSAELADQLADLELTAAAEVEAAEADAEARRMAEVEAAWAAREELNGQLPVSAMSLAEGVDLREQGVLEAVAAQCDAAWSALEAQEAALLHAVPTDLEAPGAAEVAALNRRLHRGLDAGAQAEAWVVEMRTGGALAELRQRADAPERYAATRDRALAAGDLVGTAQGEAARLAWAGDEGGARELMVGVHRLQALKSDPLAAGAVDALAPALAVAAAVEIEAGGGWGLTLSVYLDEALDKSREVIAAVRARRAAVAAPAQNPYRSQVPDLAPPSPGAGSVRSTGKPPARPAAPALSAPMRPAAPSGAQVTDLRQGLIDLGVRARALRARRAQELRGVRDALRDRQNALRHWLLREAQEMQRDHVALKIGMANLVFAARRRREKALSAGALIRAVQIQIDLVARSLERYEEADQLAAMLTEFRARWDAESVPAADRTAAEAAGAAEAVAGRSRGQNWVAAIRSGFATALQKLRLFVAARLQPALEPEPQPMSFDAWRYEVVRRLQARDPALTQAMDLLAGADPDYRVIEDIGANWDRHGPAAVRLLALHPDRDPFELHRQRVEAALALLEAADIHVGGGFNAGFLSTEIDKDGDLNCLLAGHDGAGPMPVTLSWGGPSTVPPVVTLRENAQNILSAGAAADDPVGLSLHSAALLQDGQVLVRFQQILRAHPDSKVAFLSAIVAPSAVIEPGTLRPIADMGVADKVAAAIVAHDPGFFSRRGGDGAAARAETGDHGIYRRNPNAPC